MASSNGLQAKGKTSFDSDDEEEEEDDDDDESVSNEDNIFEYFFDSF